MTLSDLTASCGDDPCDFGSEVQVNGFLTAAYELEEEPLYRLQTCMWGVCNRIYSDQINLCEHMSAIASGDNSEQECPDAGKYFFSEKMTIPTTGKSFKTRITMKSSEGGDFYVKCIVMVKVSNAYQMTWSMAAAGGLFVLATVGGAVNRRKIRSLTCSKGSTDDSRTEELMPNQTGVVMSHVII
eukprot:CAMPEP_0194035640 /NCGR_PEP_ID=MMETSP0009_2-20130614/8055_1 /TAXON_ID=210454 /ORGANISM="Grammatophora oceanica, Strain CCMP 410" /LENGTH=184 /DNA_ID=CAMNT_0038677079 /DNA_START=62 /DNA_END=616 /DNA_ORIENTATION=-